MGKRIDLLQKRFDRIVITKKLGLINGLTYWEYQCDCGKIKKASTGTINAGRIKSCGCLKDEIIGERNRKEWGQSAKNRLINIYKKRARKKNFEWSLTNEEFFSLTNLPCKYCGVEPHNTTEKISPNSYGHIVFNGIDRVNSNKGYSIDNCVPCCHSCNLAKCDSSYEEFMVWIDRLVDFRIKNESKTSSNI